MDRDKLRSEIQSDESWRGLAYDDATGKTLRKGDTLQGYVTAGWGFCLDGDRGRPMPQHIGDAWLDWLLDQVEAEMRRRWPAFDRQPGGVQRGILNMAYQMGEGGAMGFRNMIAALEAGDRARAAKECLDSKYARQTPARARRVAALIRGATDA